jgi:RNA polymerase primary sigma factor
MANSTGSALDHYLADLKRIPLVTREEEVELAKRVQQGDEVAFQKLVEANLRFVVSVAKKYQHFGVLLEDLINEGNEGLMIAARKFNPVENPGIKFISYAVWWVKQRILAVLAAQGKAVRIPTNHGTTIRLISRFQKKYQVEHGVKPTSKEIADQLDISEDIVLALGFGSNVRLDSLVTARDGLDSRVTFAERFVSDAPDPQSIFLENERKRILLKLIRSVCRPGKDNREFKILTVYYGLNDEKPMTLEGLGEFLGITRERVRQIKEKTERRLKSAILAQPKAIQELIQGRKPRDWNFS